MTTPKRDFVSIMDWSSDALWDILELSAKMKQSPVHYYQALYRKAVAMIFEKQSLRTHVTFDIGIDQLGGHCVYLGQSDVGLGTRESLYDIAKNMERWVDAVVLRTYAHETCTAMAAYMNIPVINALTDREHPCQAVGDLFTIRERLGGLAGRKLVFVGAGNNVCHSLMLIAAKFGMQFIAASPPGYHPDKSIVDVARRDAGASGGSVALLESAEQAVRDADIVYTDVWVSMGQEAEREERLAAFRRFQVNAQLMRMAKPTAVFMHCLPAHRGEEVTDEVIDSPQSIVFDQAENRLHTEKAILYALLHHT
ncbi:MAG TPA: ornithine carbamoyltransferase [Alphaproteobacteria bacterium]|nr:ornithine carbamoyltransferase [Alphaproteobacteria bacterium]